METLWARPSNRNPTLTLTLPMNLLPHANHTIGVGDGGAKGARPPPKKNPENGGNYRVKFRHYVNFFREKYLPPPKLTELLRLCITLGNLSY